MSKIITLIVLSVFTLNCALAENINIKEPLKKPFLIDDSIKIRIQVGFDVRDAPKGNIVGTIIRNYKDFNLNTTIIEIGSRITGTYKWDGNLNHQYITIKWSRIISPDGKQTDVFNKMSSTVSLKNSILTPGTETNSFITDYIYK